MNLFFDPDFARVFYGSVIALVGLACWLSGDTTLRKLALISLVLWAAYNVTLAEVGFDREPIVTATITAVATVWMATVGYEARSYTALWIVRVMVLQLLVGFYAASIGQAGSLASYLALNALFLVRMAILGGSAARMVLGPARVRAGSVHRLSGA